MGAEVSTLDAALAQVKAARHSKCFTCQLPADIRAWVEAKYLDEHTPLAQVIAALNKAGHDVGYSAALAHFRAHHERVSA